MKKKVLGLCLFVLKKTREVLAVFFHSSVALRPFSPRLLQRRRNRALAYLIVHNRDNVEDVASMCIICVARL